MLSKNKTKIKLFDSRQFFAIYGVIKYCSGWRKDVGNQRLVFEREVDLGTLLGDSAKLVC